MACLNLTSGFFIPVPWSTAPSTSVAGTTVTRTSSSISVTRTGQSGVENASGDFLYAVFGDLGFVALLRRNPGAGDITWSVSIIEASTPSIGGHLLFSVNLPSSHAPPPLAMSPGNGRLAFFFSGTGTANEVRNMMIVRSDGSGSTAVLPGPGTISGLNSNVIAEITATQLVIHHPNGGSLDTTTGPRPAGQLAVNPPNPRDFGEAILGGAPALATRSGSFVLRNNGTDCLTVSAIANNPPYTVVAPLPAFPVELDPGETMTVNVLFAPSSPSSNIERSLAVTSNPAAGASALICRGRARNAEPRIALSRSLIDFGAVPFPGARTESFTITNNGEVDLSVAIPSPASGSAFSWTPTGSSMLPTGNSLPVSVTFTAPGDFAAPDETITITPTLGATARQISFRGRGCVPNAVPVLPPPTPVDFGEVERGFRTVRFRVVRNTGDGDLEIEARILPGADPAHVALFGLVLPGADITDAPDARTYIVPPVTRCGAGATGSGEASVAVSFHASAAAGPDPFGAVLEIRTLPSGPSVSLPLSARITPAAPIDAVLVIDRSGSMNGPAGTRTKMDAALAASRLFVQMLRSDADDRAAIVSFSDSPVADRTMVEVAGNEAALVSALSFTPGGATNIAGGLIVGLDQFNNPARSPVPAGLKRAIVALTDGMENRCFQIGGAGAWYSITGRDPPPEMARPDETPQATEVLPAPTDSKIYAIAIGDPDQIDGPALDALSYATGADFSEVRDLSGNDFFLLEKHFTQIFMDVAGLAMISDPFFTIANGETHVHEFDIFPGDVGAMIVIYDQPEGRLPFFIRSPAGETFSGTDLPPGFSVRFRATPTARFAELKFPPGEPERYASSSDARWQVIVVHGGRLCSDKRLEVTVHVSEQDDFGNGFTPAQCYEYTEPVLYGIAIAAGSNLRLQAYVEPGMKLVGDSIRLNAVLAEAGLPLTGAAVTVSILRPDGSTSSLLLRDDGASADGAADDGDYGGLFTHTAQAGIYRFHFRAEGMHSGQPFARETQRTKVVYDRRRPPNEGPKDGEDCCRRTTSQLDRLRLLAYWVILLLLIIALLLFLMLLGS